MNFVPRTLSRFLYDTVVKKWKKIRFFVFILSNENSSKRMAVSRQRTWILVKLLSFVAVWWSVELWCEFQRRQSERGDLWEQRTGRCLIYSHIHFANIFVGFEDLFISRPLSNAHRWNLARSHQHLKDAFPRSRSRQEGKLWPFYSSRLLPGLNARINQGILNIGYL